MRQPEWEELAEADGQFAIAVALLAVARAIDRLGNADAATPMGGLEALGMVMKDNALTLSEALGDVASAIRETRMTDE